MQDAFLMDVIDDNILIINNRKLLKKSLLSGCDECLRISVDETYKIVFKGKKVHYGKIFGAVIGLAFAIRGLSSGDSEDGLTREQLALIVLLIYGGPSIGLGSLVDSALNGSRPESRRDVIITRGQLEGGDPAHLKEKAAMTQFEIIRQKKSKILSQLITEIQEYPMRHVERFSFYMHDQSIISGFLVSGGDSGVMLCPDFDELIDSRLNPPDNLIKVNRDHIVYYQID